MESGAGGSPSVVVLPPVSRPSGAEDDTGDGGGLLCFGEVTEGLEFIAARELDSKLGRDWAALGGIAPPPADAPCPRSRVHYQEGGGLVFFRLPFGQMRFHPAPPEEDEASVVALRAFLAGLLTVETVFVLVDHMEGLPQDASGLDAIEAFVRHGTDPAVWERALHAWHRLSSSSPSSSSSAETLSLSTFAPVFRCSCRRRGEQPWQSQEAAGFVCPLLARECR